MFTSVIIMSLILIVGCENNDCSEPPPILGFWEVINIVDDEVPIQKESPTDSIMIEFQVDGKIDGSSSRNWLSGHYQLFDNDSIWISTIGGTEVNNTNWEKKFRTIMPMITFIEFKGDIELVLYSNNRMSQITFNKHNEL